jgi:propionate catabolism operon transcriptional regulator
MQRVALLLAVEPLQALTPALMLKLAPELQNSTTSIYTKKNQPTIQAAQHSVSVHETLQRFEGNRAAAAEHLGISRTTLWRRLREE